MDFHLTVMLLGALLLVLGAVADALKRIWLTTPLLALVLGVLAGPEVLGVLDPDSFGDPRLILREVAELTLAVSLTATALQFGRRDLRENVVRGGSMLFLGTAGMFVTTTLGAWLLFDLPLAGAALLGAILTPTDPVVGAALVTGRLAEDNLPRRIRRSLQLESGGNDGLALVLVLLPVLVVAEGLGSWVGEAAAEVGIGIGVGVATGSVLGFALRFAHLREAYADYHVVAVGLGLAFVNLAGTELIGGSGFIAAFVSAILFSVILHDEAAEPLERVQTAVEVSFVLPVFALFGLMLPWDAWTQLGVAGLAFGVWVLVVRRPPVLAAVLLPTSTRPRTVGFLSWFGPIGIAAMYYLTYAESFSPADYETIFAAATLAITFSVVAHSVTATPAIRAYGRRSPLVPAGAAQEGG